MMNGFLGMLLILRLVCSPKQLMGGAHKEHSLQKHYYWYQISSFLKKHLITRYGAFKEYDSIFSLVDDIHYFCHCICRLYGSVPLRGHHTCVSFLTPSPSTRPERRCSILGRGTFRRLWHRCFPLIRYVKLHLQDKSAIKYLTDG